MTTQRIDSLDAIRGIAVLGILFMNLLSIALPTAAYETPSWHGDGSTTDKLVFSIQHLLFDGRFLTLFCLLFGAGLALFEGSVKARGYQPSKLINRRLCWLLLFGFLHGTFIWFGDILFNYALAGLFVVVTGMLNRSPSALLKIGGSLYLAGYVVFALLWTAFSFLPEDLAAEFSVGFRLSDQEFADDMALWTGPYFTQILEQLSVFLIAVIGVLFSGFFWSLVGLMLIGIALYRLDIFRTGLAPQLQWSLLGCGLLLSGYDLWLCWQWDFLNPRDMVSPWNLIAALPMALAYLSITVKLCNSSRGWHNPFRNVGRMAFTLYIAQSVSMILLFRWIAPELYGQLDRLSIFGIAAVMGLVQIVIAHLWFKYYRQGPLEKLWRHLTWYNTKPETGSQQTSV